MPRAAAFAFSSSLPAEHREEAERILFFNLQQEKMKDGIRAVSKTYGLPKLVSTGEDEERLHMATTKGLAVQTLFVTARGIGADGPVGAIVFTREENALVALYMAVHEDFSATGKHAGEKLMIRMLKELEGIARRVRGVEVLRLYLGGETPISKKIRR
ncbi:MAG: hypothetical protein ACE37F_03375 [Nannocystaceae bacterium]|nr:hypothetical protein [bacterium]